MGRKGADLDVRSRGVDERLMRQGRSEKPVASAYRRYVAAKAARHKDGVNDIRALSAAHEGALWSAAADCLSAYAAARNWSHDADTMQGPKESLPPEIAFDLADAVGSVVAGKWPSTFAALRARGAPGLTPAERGDVEAAVRYIVACLEGLIADRSPVKTIRGEFMVAASTVRRWRQLCANVGGLSAYPNEWSPERKRKTIELVMRKSAEHYRLLGRGLEAVAKRDHKRARQTPPSVAAK